MKNVIYTNDQYNVYAGKRIIAAAYVSEVYPVRILQGMNRTETIKKICQDCPDYAKEYGITENYYPKLFSPPKPHRKGDK
jgi:hypothetical protein